MILTSMKVFLYLRKYLGKVCFEAGNGKRIKVYPLHACKYTYLSIYVQMFRLFRSSA